MDQDRSKLNEDDNNNNTANLKMEKAQKEITRFRVEPKEVIDETEKERMQKNAAKFEDIVEQLFTEKDHPSSKEE
jgi:hypothetical protein